MDRGRKNMHASSTHPDRPPDGQYQPHWVSVLAGLEDREILEVCTEGRQGIVWLSSSNGEQITCTASLGGAGEDPAMEWWKSADALAAGSLDVAIVDRESFYDSIQSESQFRAALGKVGRALKQEGLLLLWLRGGFRHLRHRYWVGRVLAQEGYKSARYYLADHSEECVTFVPYSDDSAWAASYLSYRSGSRVKSSVLLKKVVKRVLYGALGTYNPRFGLLILARKWPTQALSRTPSFSQRLKEVVSGKAPLDGGSVVVLAASRRSDTRNLLLDYDKGSSRLLAVARFLSKSHDVVGLVRRLYDNLILLSSVEEALAERRIAVPTLLDSEVSGPMIFYVLNALSGQCLQEQLDDWCRRDDRAALASFVNSALELQIFIQDNLTQSLGDRAPKIEDRYFENYLRLPMDSPHAISGMDFRVVQHGDFAPVNIFYDAAEKRWGVIDWEWMGTGYPLLFDVFSFLCAVGLTIRWRKGPARVPERVERFANTFFDTTWFSQIVRDRVRLYCDHYEIPRNQVYPLFLRYLVFQCGKYRLAVADPPGFLTSNEEILRYAIEHKERFILA